MLGGGLSVGSARTSFRVVRTQPWGGYIAAGKHSDRWGLSSRERLPGGHRWAGARTRKPSSERWMESSHLHDVPASQRLTSADPPRVGPLFHPRSIRMKL
jgi:hypothetical protein